MLKPQNDKDAFSLINESGNKMIVFGAPWCSPCKRLEEHIENILENEYPSIKFVKIDVQKCSQTSMTNKIQGLPTIYVMQDENIVSKHEGFGSIDVVRKALNAIH